MQIPANSRPGSTDRETVESARKPLRQHRGSAVAYSLHPGWARAGGALRAVDSCVCKYTHGTANILAVHVGIGQLRAGPLLCAVSQARVISVGTGPPHRRNDGVVGEPVAGRAREPSA